MARQYYIRREDSPTFHWKDIDRQHYYWRFTDQQRANYPIDITFKKISALKAALIMCKHPQSYRTASIIEQVIRDCLEEI